MSLVYYLADDGITYVPVTLENPLPVSSGGGPGGEPQPVTAEGEYVELPRDLAPGDTAPLLLNQDGMLLVNLAMFAGADQPYETFVQPLTQAQLVAARQGNIASGPVTLVAGVAQTIIGAFPDRRGMNVLNYTSSPVYLSNGITGTPASGAGSLFVAAADEIGPGQFTFPYAPVNGVRAVGAAAGGLTVTVW